MTTRLPIVFTAALALLLAAATPTRAQLPPLPGGGLPGIIGDLTGPSPCCACDPATGTRCDDLVLTGLGNSVSGCVGVNPLVCTGGQLLDAAVPALQDGCTCVGPACFGPLSLDFEQFPDAATCTAEAARACGEAGGAVECACGDGADNDGNGATDCDDAACAGDPACEPCPTGQERCNGVCIDTQTDEANCGSCGNACTTGETCEAGVCSGDPGCTPPQTECNGTCTDTQTDPNNCGECANACAPGQTCTAGDCTGCATGQTDCNGTCVDLSGDEANCGTCGTACQTGQTCQNGTCSGCTDGKTECNGSCVDLTSDEQNCGACGTACDTGETCTNGTCTAGPSCGDGTCAVGEVCPADCDEETNCGDGVDNDNDGKLDCADRDCKGNRSGGGDGTNPGGGGNPRGFCNPGGLKK